MNNDHPLYYVFELVYPVHKFTTREGCAFFWVKMVVSLFHFYRVLRTPLKWCGRAYFFCFGFHWINIKGKQVDSGEAPVLVVAPHSTFFDVLSAFVCGLPGAISRIENGRVPVFGSM